LAVASATLFAIGCDSGDGGASCGGDATCGGDLVGTWAIVSSCNVAETAMPTGLCADQRQYSISGLEQTGTYTFLPDGTVSMTVMMTGLVRDVFPAACLAPTGLLTCAELDLQNRQLVQTGMFYSSASCAMTGTSCACTMVLDTTVASTGTYAISGSTVTVTVNGASGDSSYCVEGSMVTVSTPNANGRPPARYVLARQ
jgi:hypothetical protein